MKITVFTRAIQNQKCKRERREGMYNHWVIVVILSVVCPYFCLSITIRFGDYGLLAVDLGMKLLSMMIYDL